MKHLEISRFPTNANPATMLEIATNYSVAIVRRGRKATDPEFLAYIWASYGAYFVEHEGSFLILYKVGEIYVASHFAPTTIRGGVRLLERVAEDGLPIVFCVPDDLSRNLKKLGWLELPKFARIIAAKKGLPRHKQILVPKGLARLAWTYFKNLGDVYAAKESSPAPTWGEEELEELDRSVSPVTRINRAVAKWWDRQTQLPIPW